MINVHSCGELRLGSIDLEALNAAYKTQLILSHLLLAPMSFYTADEGQWIFYSTF